MGIIQRIWFVILWVGMQQYAYAKEDLSDVLFDSEQVLALINQVRSVERRCGNEKMPAAKPLRWSGVLALSAQNHANDLARSHTDKVKRKSMMSAFERNQRDGYIGRGGYENTASGYGRIQTVIEVWLQRPMNCKILMNSEVDEMGMAVAMVDGHQYGQYWVQHLGVAFQEANSMEMLALINQARSVDRMCGTELMLAVAPLKWNETLAVSAHKHVRDMVENNYFQHNSQDGMTPFDRNIRDGYMGWGGRENIAVGANSAREVIDGWLKSPGHCRNLMNAEISEVGMAWAFHVQNGGYWVQNFGIDPERFQQIRGYSIERAIVVY